VTVVVDDAWFTVTAVEPVDAAAAVSPPKVAVTVPVVNVVVVMHPVPATNTTVELPPPGSVNVTVPVGIPEPGGSMATVAQTSTDSPATDGFGVAVTIVVVDAWFTVTEMVAADDVEFEFPL